MGIHGLTSFIDNNPHLLKDHHLHNGRVVIDGNNLYHFLYYYCNVRFQYGGDYDVFHRKIVWIFNMFKSCNVEVFVVFDGAYTVDGKKLKTTIGRARDRVFASQRIMHGRRGTLIPCLAQHTFRQTLDEMGIPHVTCDFEADNQLATLANRWNCPVISNDSDFYIFDLSGGFIPLDYIDFRPSHITGDADTGQSYTFLPVQYYHVDEFIKCFKSLSRSVLPLFATMLGNDYVDAAAFETFYQKRTPKIASKRYAASKKHQKIVSVMYWLEEKHYQGSQELVSQVLSFIRQDRRQQVEKLLTESINGYTDTQAFESFDLKAFLEGDRSAAMQETECVTTTHGEGLPPWFLAACRCGEMPVFLLNAVLLHHVILPTQVESTSKPAAFVTSKTVREAIYSLLLKREAPTMQGLSTELPSGSVYSNPPQDIKNESDTPSLSSQVEASVAKSNCIAPAKETGILEYTRHYKELWRVMVQPCSGLPTFGEFPSLEGIPSLSTADRRAIVVETLGVTSSFADRFEPSMQLYMMCLVHWARQATPSVSLHHLKGLLLSAVLLHVHKELANRRNLVIEEGVSKDNSEMICDALDHQDEKGLGSGSVLLRMSQKHLAGSTVNKTSESQEYAQKCLNISSECHSVDDRLLRKVQDNLKKYYHDPVKISDKNPPDQEVFHANAQLQACLLDAVHLNSLLQCPLPTPHPATLFNGTFVYSVTHELKVRSNPELFLAEMLVKGSPLIALFDSLCAEVVQEIGMGVLAEQKIQGKKCCKGAKKKGKAAAAVTQRMCAGDSSVVTDSEEHAKRERDVIVASCDLSNRFGLLLEDDS